MEVLTRTTFYNHLINTHNTATRADLINIPFNTVSETASFQDLINQEQEDETITNQFILEEQLQSYQPQENTHPDRPPKPADPEIIENLTDQTPDEFTQKIINLINYFIDNNLKHLI